MNWIVIGLHAVRYFRLRSKNYAEVEILKRKRDALLARTDAIKAEYARNFAIKRTASYALSPLAGIVAGVILKDGSSAGESSQELASDGITENLPLIGGFIGAQRAINQYKNDARVIAIELEATEVDRVMFAKIFEVQDYWMVPFVYLPVGLWLLYYFAGVGLDMLSHP